jgi:hypothetical protein
MSDDAEFESEPEDPEEQSLTLANSLHVLIYGLFALAVVPPLLSCLGLWPAIFVAGPFSWFLICGPSVSIVLISLLGFFLTHEKLSRRWYVGAILAALGLPFCCTGWSGYVYKLLSGVVGLC